MPLLSEPTAKNCGRQSAARASSLNGGAAKKQRKSDDRSEAGASATRSNTDDDGLPSPAPDEYTDILGPDAWTPPKASSGSWEEPVQSVETVEADDDGRLWVFLSWNLQNEDGRFLRNKVKASTCYRACPQKVCLHPTLIRSSRNSLPDSDAEILWKPSVSSISNLSPWSSWRKPYHSSVLPSDKFKYHWKCDHLTNCVSELIPKDRSYLNQQKQTVREDVFTKWTLNTPKWVRISFHISRSQSTILCNLEVILSLLESLFLFNPIFLTYLHLFSSRRKISSLLYLLIVLSTRNTASMYSIFAFIVL